MDSTEPQIGVVGAGEARESIRSRAEELGRRLARAGAVVWTGGRGGVMEAACLGAREEGGSTVGVLPGRSARETPPNPYVETVVFTGLGQARNLVLVLSVDAVVAIGGSWGTLSEIALAKKHERPVVLLDSWELVAPDGTGERAPEVARDVAEASRRVLELAAEARRG